MYDDATVDVQTAAVEFELGSLRTYAEVASRRMGS
jgi:hypothetical protein